MAQLVGVDEIESLRTELSEVGRSLRSSFRHHTSSFRSNSNLSSLKDNADVEFVKQWAEINRLPTFERLRSSLIDDDDDEDEGDRVDAKGKRLIDVTKLGSLERHLFIEKLIKHIENDNLRLLHKLRKRIDKVGVKLPTVEVRYKNMHVQAECEVVHGKPLPTLWNSLQSMISDITKLTGFKSKEAKINIINNVSGIIKPGRMTLLLGPPGCGKTSFLKALSGNLDKSLKMLSTNTTIGQETLESRGLDFDGYFFWISLGALFGFILLFNIGFILALSFLKPPGTRAIISSEKLSQIQGSEESTKTDHIEEKSRNKGRMVLPFEPVSVVFQDIQYYVDTPLEMRERGFSEKKLQLLCDITGAFRPGVLTTLMGVSGAGKTTLLDVLAGRKTSGTIKGEIKIGGYPKVQETFARISGYCEQTDIHSPQVTIEESVTFSAWLRLHPQIDSKTKFDFVKDVLETVELDGLKDALVGIPGVSGLSTEQRKRLTIAVELVSNPSIIFMDEPTTGLDARSAAIVMRAVKNVVDTGRTIVCTIHQPSIDIFEAFDELILLKSGGRVIYSGPLGKHSSNVIEYFEGISGVPNIRNNYNPATWMLEVTSILHEGNKEVVKSLSIPPPGSKELYFPTRFSQNGWGQFKSCLWKQHLSYWRSPSYNLMRSMHMIFSSLLFGILFWDQGQKIENQQSLFSIFGSMFSSTIFAGINNASSVLPYVSTERNVLYRERFAGMYAPWAYALAQVTIEVPYLFAQSLVYVIITYPMIGYYWSAYKVLWFFYSMFCTLLYFTYMGMMIVSITPTFPVAAILQSSFYTMFNLFSGFIIPQPQIPKWWVWFYYLIPTSWTLNGMLSSQYGDIEKKILAFGERKTVAAFIKDYFGFHHDRLPLVGVIMMLYPIVFASIFAYCIGKLNFQRR